jgi:LPXTG-site transpeptidase (sortase) family protein
LTNVDVSDPDVDTTGCTWTTPLAVDASTSCVVGSVTAQTGSNTNTASAGSDETGADFDSDDAEYVGQTIGIDLEKTPASQTILLGGSATFSLEVSNTGDLLLQITSLTDAFCDTLNGPTGDTDNDGWLATTETWIYQCVDNVVNADYTNSAEVQAEDAGGNPVSDTATALVDVISPSINIEKTVYLGNSGAASCPGVELVSGLNGADITYCFIVTNTGDTVLDISTFTDNEIGIALGDLTLGIGSDADSDGLLDTSETWTYTYATTINGDVIPNTATINAQPTDGTGTTIPGTSEVSDSDTANVDEIVTDLVLDKSLTAGSPYTNVGDILSYSFTVTNSGGTILAGPVTINDDYIGSFTCGDLTTVGNNDTNFDPGEAITCTNTYAVQQADIDSGSVINTASAMVDGETSNTDSATATATQTPELTISKLPDIQSVPLNTTFSFTISVTNSGNTVLNNVQVTDDLESIFGTNYTLIGSPAVSTTGLLPANSSYDGDTDTNLLDPGQTRSLGAGQTETITITLQVSTTGTFVNTAYGQAEDPAGSPVGPESDTGSVTLTSAGAFSIEKNLVSTEQNTASSGANQLVTIGELVTYEVIVTLHDASTAYEDIMIIDTLDHGLAFHSCTSITSSFVIAGLACDEGNGLPDVAPPVGTPAGEDDGRFVYFSLGDITTPATADNTITLTYQAVVLNIDDNQSSPITILNNTAAWGTTNVTDAGDPLQVTEPFLAIAKTSNNSVANAGDLISFDIEIRHSASSTATAYDVVLHDVIPAGLVYTPTSNPDHRLESISGPAPTAVGFVAGEVLAQWNTLDLTDVAVVRLYASIDPAVSPGTVINNVSSVEWTSLPGNLQTPRSPYNDFSTERWYDPDDPSNVNIYGGITSADTVTVGGIPLPEELPQTGFAPNQITALPPQPFEYKNYAEGFWMEIPILGISAPIAGVPHDENGWDTTWLWNQLGYLEGTAFPTWEGNTAITGHVFLPDGTAGPFQRIGLLRWGNEVVIHANGLKYVYEVRSNRLVFPNNTSILEHTDEDWVTLITCSYFNQHTNQYRYRIAVQAVLMRIEAE